MDNRATLYALASEQLVASRRKLGWIAFGSFLLAAVLGSASENTMDRLAAWMFGFAAIAFFARYAGDCSEIKRLELSRTAPAPLLPLTFVTQADEALIRIYGKILQRYDGGQLIPITRLPASKDRLKRIMAAGIKQAECPSDRLVLEEGYLSLSRFQPLPNGVSDLPTIVSADEYLCLTSELATLVRTGGA